MKQIFKTIKTLLKRANRKKGDTVFINVNTSKMIFEGDICHCGPFQNNAQKATHDQLLHRKNLYRCLETSSWMFGEKRNVFFIKL